MHGVVSASTPQTVAVCNAEGVPASISPCAPRVCGSLAHLNSISLVVETKPEHGPGSRPAASTAASPVLCSPITTHCPASRAARASATTEGICTRAQ